MAIKGYALLDYDGYICKSFYANKDDMMNFESAEKILKDLTQCAKEKACKWFNAKPYEINIIKVVSGHSWKKDIYPSYKRTRKRDEFLGLYRQAIIEKMKDLVIVPQLEADEVLIALSDYIRAVHKGNSIVFSDDKDLRYYTEKYCKINILEQVVEQHPDELLYNQLEQMLIGDKEDNIQGIPKVGEKTAEKLLKQVGYNFDNVIKLYKDKGIEIDQTLRDLLLLIPLSDSYLNETEPLYTMAHQILDSGKANDLTVCNTLITQIQYLNGKVKEIYDRED